MLTARDAAADVVAGPTPALTISPRPLAFKCCSRACGARSARHAAQAVRLQVADLSLDAGGHVVAAGGAIVP
jgi:hypothetical protein